MPLGTPALLASGNHNVDAASFAQTLSRALGAYELGLAFVHNHSTNANVPTFSGGGVTWVQVNTYMYDTVGAQARLTVFRAMGATPAGGNVTADFGGVVQQTCQIFVCGITGADRTGTNGAGAVLQSKLGPVDGVGTSTTITLTNALRAGSMSVAAFAHEANEATTAGGGGEIGDVTTTLYGAAFELQYVLGSPSVSASWATSTNYGAISVEVSGGIYVAGSIAPSGTLGRLTNKSPAGGITPTGVLAKLMKEFLGGSIAPVGTTNAARLLQKLFGGAITPVGTLFPQLYKTWYVAIAGALSPSGTLAARFLGLHYLALSGMIAPFGSLIPTYLKRLLIGFSEGSVDVVPKTEDALDFVPKSEDATLDLTKLDSYDG